MKRDSSSEATLTRKTPLWCTENPHATVEGPLHSDKICVWVAISRRRIIGPIFFTETIDSDRYCLQILFPFIDQLNEDEINNALFQQDFATSHSPSSDGIIG
jgi:hypothetical protein